MAVSGRQVRETLFQAVRHALEVDPHIPRLNERALVARIAMIFHASAGREWMPPDYLVDTDYNAGGMKRELGLGRYIDLVVHNRLLPGANLFAAEFKRSDNADGIVNDEAHLRFATGRIGGYGYPGVLPFRPRRDVWPGRRADGADWPARGGAPHGTVRAQAGYRLGARVVLGNDDRPWWADVLWFAEGGEIGDVTIPAQPGRAGRPAVRAEFWHPGLGDVLPPRPSIDSLVLTV